MHDSSGEHETSRAGREGGGPVGSAQTEDVFDRKLRNRMLWRVLLSASLVMVVLAAVIYLLVRQMMVSELKQKSRIKVALASVSINDWLREKSEMLEVVALRQSAGMLPSEDRKRFFRDMCRQFGCIVSLYQAFEADGAFFTGSDWKPPPGYDPRKRHWFVRAKAAERTIYSKPYRDPYTKRLVVTIATPVERDGKFLGVLAMDVFLDRILKRVNDLRIGSGSYAYLVDDTGLVVAHPKAERVLETKIQQTGDAAFYRRFRQGEPRPGRAESQPRPERPSQPQAERPSEPQAERPSEPQAERPSEPQAERPSEPQAERPSQPQAERPSQPQAERQGQPLTVLYEAEDYVTLSRIPESGWMLVFHLPREEVNRPLERVLLVFLVGVVVALLLLAGTIAYISHRIVHPILDLAAGASRVAEGDYEQRLAVTSRDEIGLVTRAFNEMSVGLKDRDFIKSTFGRYVSQAVMRDILSGNIKLGGEITDLTILFSDIRGFTTLSEGMTPQDLVALLNRYFSRMDGAIREAGGSINKYLGDGILALYGAPERLPNAAERAVESAYGMLTHLEELNRDRAEPVRIGVGVHTGEAVVGNIGSESRTEYTVIGDAVNLASRIQSLTRRYEQPILVSETTASRLPEESWVLRLVDRVQVKGKVIPVTLHAPLRRADLDDARLQWLTRSDAVLQEYFAGRFQQALDLLSEMEEPDHLLLVIRDRCQQYIEDPPDQFDGVFVHRSK